MYICTFTTRLIRSTLIRNSAPTHVIALENTLSGQIFPQKDIIEISEFAHSQGILMHLDGARIWHVAAEMGTPMKELCDPFDSVSICFSKGLGEVFTFLFPRSAAKCGNYMQVRLSGHVW